MEHKIPSHRRKRRRSSHTTNQVFHLSLSFVFRTELNMSTLRRAGGLFGKKAEPYDKSRYPSFRLHERRGSLNQCSLFCNGRVPPMPPLQNVLLAWVVISLRGSSLT